jgi:hypothetical protein
MSNTGGLAAGPAVENPMGQGNVLALRAAFPAFAHRR